MSVVETIESTDDVCEICRDGEPSDDNPILYCDNCDVAVHQGCYSVHEIPGENDPWCVFDQRCNVICLKFNLF